MKTGFVKKQAQQHMAFNVYNVREIVKIEVLTALRGSIGYITDVRNFRKRLFMQ